MPKEASSSVLRALSKRKTYHYGFTLAEVLITLTIVGVIAALTIPNLMAKHEEIATVNKLKKSYSVLKQAFQLAIQENGEVETWMASATTPCASIDKIVPYLKVYKKCRTNKNGCFASGYPKQLNNTDYWLKIDEAGWICKIQLDDGTSFAITYMWGDTYKNVSWAYIDINGPKKPNQFGKDLFFFKIDNNGLTPYGGKKEEGQSEFYHNYDCPNVRSRGLGCAKWVIERGNMDYLHKNTLW